MIPAAEIFARIENEGPGRPSRRQRARVDHIVELYALGLTYQQIADATNLSVATVGERIRTGRRRGANLPYRRKIKR